MCGACPGGASLSEATVFLGVRGATARAGRLLQSLTGDRIQVAVFGDGWSVRLPTGGLTVANSFEEVVERCGPYIDLRALARLRQWCPADEVADLVVGAAAAALSRTRGETRAHSPAAPV
ncbi:hypothetical protein [Leucobacter celer]|uniref:hypothetical protein n=1 Tax=Leucobacter celer TaxID=668625 RepID=UPI0006A7AF4D|nr:hypothetical protein [Leucobacter celer]